MPEATSDSTGSVSLLRSTVISAKEWSTWTLPTTATSSECTSSSWVSAGGWEGGNILASHRKGHCSSIWSCDLTSFFFSIGKTGGVGITGAIHRLLLAVSRSAGNASERCQPRGRGPACCSSVVVRPPWGVSLPALGGTLAGPDKDNSKAGITQKLVFLNGKSIRKGRCVGWLQLPRAGVKMHL